jgi:Rrf2 family nitric oxide-sensitive transcriptional repressor
MFSQTVEYALRAMTQLASEAPGPSSTSGIAKAAKLPAAYLAKVVQDIRRAKLVTTRRGVGGRVKLAKPASKITLFDVIEAVEPINRNGNGKTAKSLAGLHRKLDELTAALVKGCKATMLADVAKCSKSLSRQSPAPR